MKRRFSLLFCICFAYAPLIQILVHEDCVYSKSLIILLNWSGTPYEKLNLEENMQLLKNNKSIPKVFVNKKYIGGYRDSLINWKMIFKMLPNEKDPKSLFDPNFVIEKYGDGKNKVALPIVAKNSININRKTVRFIDRFNKFNRQVKAF